MVIHWLGHSQSMIKEKNTKTRNKTMNYTCSCFFGGDYGSLFLQLHSKVTVFKDQHEIMVSASESIELSHECLKIDEPSLFKESCWPFRKWFRFLGSA
jgi:hypothetical protein